MVTDTTNAQHEHCKCGSRRKRSKAPIDSSREDDSSSSSRCDFSSSESNSAGEEQASKPLVWRKLFSPVQCPFFLYCMSPFGRWVHGWVSNTPPPL